MAYDDLEFPKEVAQQAINDFNISEDNLQEFKDFIYHVNSLTSTEASDLINELFDNLGV